MKLYYTVLAISLCMQVAYATHCAVNVFGYPLASRPIGIAACPLTATSEGIKKAAECGYDVLTYKTIRSAYNPIKSSILYYVDVHEQLTHQHIGSRFSIIDHEPTVYDRAITNCYGIGSLNPQETIADIQKTRALLAQGQLLIVSIYGSGSTIEEQINDFVRTAQIAYAGGAQVIEANLSCPNLANTELMYKQPALVYTICHAIRSAVPQVPLSIKVGVFDSYAQMHEVIMAAHQGGAQGICGINTVPVQVVNRDGKPVYGYDRKSSGLSGMPIHELALEFTRNARAIIDSEKLDMVLCAAGGVMCVQDFDALFTAGADIALCATSALLGESLAMEYKKNNS